MGWVLAARRSAIRYLINDDEEGERQFKLILSQGDKDALISIISDTSIPAAG